MTFKILIVDDEAANLRLLERLFRSQFQVISASSGSQALELLSQHDVAIIISDQLMPGMTGIEFLKRTAEISPYTIRIILTGYTDVNALVEAINSRIIYKYVSKPWINEDLQQTVTRGLESYKANKRLHELSLNCDRLSARIQATKNGFLQFITEALNSRNIYAYAHARRTSDYAAAIAHRFNIESEELEQVSLAAFLHEINQLIIPDNCFSADLLCGNESQIGKLYTERGVRILASTDDMSQVALAIRHFEEQYDGAGKPEGLQGEQIPFCSRIISVANAYDEMTSSTDSRKGISHDEAIKNLRENAGHKFDPGIVDEFCELKPLGKIRNAIVEGMTGMQLLPNRVFPDVNEISTPELLQKFKTEPLLAMDVLRLVNITNKELPATQLLSAMTQLGEAKLRLLIEHDGLPAPDDHTDSFARQAIRCAIAAELLAAHTNIINPDDAYTLGLLHNVGEVLLRNLFPDEMLALFEVEEDPQRYQIEIFGVSAGQISQWMLEACGVPCNLAIAVNFSYDKAFFNIPIASLMYLAFQISKAADINKFSAFDKSGADVLSVLNLSRMDLNLIYERANAISDQRINARQMLYEYV